MPYLGGGGFPIRLKTGDYFDKSQGVEGFYLWGLGNQSPVYQLEVHPSHVYISIPHLSLRILIFLIVRDPESYSQKNSKES